MTDHCPITGSARPLADLATPFPDILTLLRARSAASPDAIAIEDITGGARSYLSLLRRTEALAAQISDLAEGGHRPRIGIVMPNGGVLAETLLAVTCIGVALPFNPAYTAPEFESYFTQTDIRFVLTLSDFAPVARQVAERLGLRVIDVDMLPTETAGRITAIPAPDPDAVAMVLLTSGSTGLAKRVPLSHRNVCTSARDVSVSLRLAPADRCLTMWEMFHVGGLVDLLLAPLHSGGTVIVTPGFAAQQFFDLVPSRKPTWFQAVPAALGELSLTARRNGIVPAGSSLRFLRSVAAALSPALMAEAEALFGIPVLQTFGMTEAGPLITSTGFDAANRVQGSVGRSCGTEIGIFDEDWKRRQPDTEGEVAIRGPNVFSGYEADPVANLAAFRDGWFRTGDLGRVDPEGRLFLTGRIKELVNRGGEKINLREVDDALLSHPAVQEAASFPIPHRTLGEDVAAAVVLRPDTDASETSIRDAVAARLAAFKVPRSIVFLPALPHTAVGKIDRRQLASDALVLINARDARPVPDDATSATEARIAAIWARELGLHSVGPRDDFVSLGGDSLAAVRVMLGVEAAFATPLPDDILATITTVRAMAELLGNRFLAHSGEQKRAGDVGLSEDRRKIVAVIAMGSIPVLRTGSIFKVLNRDATGQSVIWFFNRPAAKMRAMSEHFPANRPFYGGYSGGKIFDMSDDTMNRLARLYLAEITAEFPQGSFIIGGNCKGARLAWEVTKLLQQQGRIVERLCLVEFSSPELAAFDAPMLLMFGKQSRRKAYRAINWGDAGWDRNFRHPPTATWIDGKHGGFFRGKTIAGLNRTLTSFLDGAPVVDGTLASRSGRRVMWVHRNRALFLVYRAVHMLKTRLGHIRRSR